MVGTVVRVKGIKRYREPKTGKTYCYHRATGVRIKEEFGSAEFFNRLAELNDQAREQAELVAKPGTLKALILDYKQTDEFKDLANRTRSDYEKVFVFLEPLWDAQLSQFTAPKLNNLRIKWRKTRGRRFVNYIRTVLSLLFEHGTSIGVMFANPARNMKTVKRPRNAPKMNRAWTPEERRIVLDRLPAHLKLPVAIGLYTGMREGDVLSLPRDIIQANSIKIITSKRLVKIDLQILPELRKALRAAPGHDAPTLCANSRGQPWTLNGFSSSFRKQIKKLLDEGVVGPGLTFHGTRHTVATELAEAGVSAEDIAAVLGQRESRMASHYAEEADRSQRSRAAIKKYKPLKAH